MNYLRAALKNAGCTAMCRHHGEGSPPALIYPQGIQFGVVGGPHGDVVGMHYCSFWGHYYSWALPDHIRTNLFSMYGLSCSNGSYNESLVKSNLENRLPIIVTASDCLVPADFDIHTFVIVAS